MAVLFIDTSALVRRYDAGEPGAQRVRQLCQRSTGHAPLIAQLTRVEIASALNRKVRQGQLSPIQRDQRSALFRRHARQQYRVVTLGEPIYRETERLLAVHPLRAYDAVQLASALQGLSLLAGLSPDYRFCTADQDQAVAAVQEGLTVELIS